MCGLQLPRINPQQFKVAEVEKPCFASGVNAGKQLGGGGKHPLKDEDMGGSTKTQTPLLLGKKKKSASGTSHKEIPTCTDRGQPSLKKNKRHPCTNFWDLIAEIKPWKNVNILSKMRSPPRFGGVLEFIGGGGGGDLQTGHRSPGKKRQLQGWVFFLLPGKAFGALGTPPATSHELGPRRLQKLGEQDGWVPARVSS